MSRPELYPVAELSWFDGPCPYPWAVAPERAAFDRVRLCWRTTGDEVGWVAASLADVSGVAAGPDAGAVLAALATADYLSLRGGLAVEAGDRLILPSCCTSLGEWRDWPAGLRDGSSPWMGHDPSAWVEWGGETVRVWSDGHFNPAPSAFAIDLPRGEVAAQLDRVADDLRAFADRLAGWAAGQGLVDSGRLGERFRQRFGPAAPPPLPADD